MTTTARPRRAAARVRLEMASASMIGCSWCMDLGYHSALGPTSYGFSDRCEIPARP